MSEGYHHRESSIEIRCDCAGKCTIFALDIYEWGDEPQQVFAEFYTAHGESHLRWRIQQAWRMLLGKQHYLDALSISRTDLVRLRDFLNEETGLAASPEAHRGPVEARLGAPKEKV